MFNSRAVAGVPGVLAALSSVLFFLALQVSLSVALGAGGDSTSLSSVAAEHTPPSPAPVTGQDSDADSAKHEGHGAAADLPGVESSHGHEGGRGRNEERLRGPGPEQDAHDHGHEETVEVHLSSDQRQAVDLEISALQLRAIGETLSAPGEVRLNAYATTQVTPRIDAQVTARHARLGEHVERGQLLATLSSVDMAEAQGDMVVAEREWQRLTKLKGQFVSESDYLEASVARQKALSRVLAYGMTQTQADSLVSGASEKVDGTFDLLAPQSGTVIRDPFLLGEIVEPGRVLFEITDESVRWVEAQMPPEEAARVSGGDQARVAYRNTWLDGRVTQIHHLLDETTRTQAVRVEVPDPAHRLHPGVFVDVVIVSDAGDPVLILPESAVLRGPDGDWQIFVAKGEDTFSPVEVELLRMHGGMAVIEGVPAGTRVVTRGAFFLQSELAKGGFDPHNH